MDIRTVAAGAGAALALAGPAVADSGLNARLIGEDPGRPVNWRGL